MHGCVGMEQCGEELFLEPQLQQVPAPQRQPVRQRPLHQRLRLPVRLRPLHQRQRQPVHLRPLQRQRLLLQHQHQQRQPVRQRLLRPVHQRQPVLVRVQRQQYNEIKLWEHIYQTYRER